MSQRGFSLVEVLIATLILTTGILSLLGVIGVAVQRAVSSSDAVIAREKAREAVESVHTARDMAAVSWPSIRNVDVGGLFLNGPQPLRLAGADGLVNTADDGDVENLQMPGQDGILGTEDDTVRALDGFTREIVISDLPANNGGIDPNLREITVHIRYEMRGTWRTYTLRTYVSAFL
jgi:prepilin-type N-terminal cleavage/methylation domain-containing protein